MVWASICPHDGQQATELGGVPVRRAAVLFITVTVLVIFVGILVVSSLSVVERVTEVSQVEGLVEVRGPADRAFRTVTDPERVLAGTVLRTGDSGQALLRWADGTKLSVGVDTQLTIEKCRLHKSKDTSVSVFKLDVGRIWVHVVKALSADSKFEIDTPTATAGVRGTMFAVEVKPDGATDVLVYEGNVAVQAGSQPLGVGEGQALAVATCGTTGVRDLTDDEMTEGLATLEEDEEKKGE